MQPLLFFICYLTSFFLFFFATVGDYTKSQFVIDVDVNRYPSLTRPVCRRTLNHIKPIIMEKCNKEKSQFVALF